MTIPDQRPAPVQTRPWDFSHSPGVAKITGTPTTKTKESIISKTVSNCKIPAMWCYLSH